MSAFHTRRLNYFKFASLRLFPINGFFYYYWSEIIWGPIKECWPLCSRNISRHKNSIVFVLIGVCKSRFHTSLNIWNVISSHNQTAKGQSKWAAGNFGPAVCWLIAAATKIYTSLQARIAWKKSGVLCVGQSKYFLSVRAGSKPGPFRVWILCRGAAMRGSGILFLCVWQQQLLARLDFASNHSFGLGKLNNRAEESGRRGITFLCSCSAFYV